MPVDDNNHALGALSYLISRLDARYMAKLRRIGAVPSQEPTPEFDQDRLREAQEACFRAKPVPHQVERQARWDNPAVWENLR